MLNHLKKATNVAYTENGARAYATTNSSLLDLFSQGGSLRSRSESDIISLFTKAFAEDNLLALKMLFYLRDIRGGAGERRTFRIILKYMANNHPEYIRKNIELIPYYGRWDDLYELVGTKLEKDAFEVIKEQFIKDLRYDSPSLMAKWLKSENASSQETKRLAKKTREALGLTPRDYRKSLSLLREKINIVERQMSSRQWEDIDYSKLPSQAGLRYREAFYRNDGERYQAFIDSLKRGDKDVKINTKALFPYEIISRIPGMDDYRRYGSRYNVNPVKDTHDADVLDVLWNNLPDYFDGKEENSIAVVDTSASMRGLPIQVALSLGVYLAERNKGPYHNHFLTFSNRPSMVEIQGSNIVEKVHNMSKANWDMNTDISAVFGLILETAIDNATPQEEMIQRIYIVSDMEFDYCATNKDEALFERIRRDFEANGYQMPSLVFWNVDARNQQFPMMMNESGVQMVSGCSPSIFTNLLKGNMLTPYELMLDVLNGERYEKVRV